MGTPEIGNTQSEPLPDSEVLLEQCHVVQPDHVGGLNETERSAVHQALTFEVPIPGERFVVLRRNESSQLRIMVSLVPGSGKPPTEFVRLV